MICILLSENNTNITRNHNRSTAEANLDECFNLTDCKGYLLEGANLALTLDDLSYVSADVGTAIAYAAELLGDYFLGGEYEV